MTDYSDLSTTTSGGVMHAEEPNVICTEMEYCSIKLEYDDAITNGEIGPVDALTQRVAIEAENTSILQDNEEEIEIGTPTLVEMATERGIEEYEIEEDCLDTDSYNENEYDSESEEEDEGLEVSDVGRESTWRPPQEGGYVSGVHPFTGNPRGLRRIKTRVIKRSSTPLSIFLLYFSEVILLLVEETNRYYQQHVSNVDEGFCPKPDVTLPEMYLFLAIIIQMGHSVRDSLRDYWTTLQPFHSPFYAKTMRRDRFLHILRFLHFSDNKNKPDWRNENYDRLWKFRTVFEMLNDAYAKYYSPSEHLVVDEIIVHLKGSGICKQSIPTGRIGIKSFKLSDSTGYTCDMGIYLGKAGQSATQDMTAKHATVRHLTRRVEGVGHKLFMDNFFSSPTLFDYLTTKKINCCGTVLSNKKGMPKDFDGLKLKLGDICTRTRDDLTAMVWKGNIDGVYMLTNIHPPPGEGNFVNRHGNPRRPAIVEDYVQHMRSVEKGDTVTHSFSIIDSRWKWTKKFFFHLVALTILNSSILLSSCGGEFSLCNFRLNLVRDLVERSAVALPSPGGRQNLVPRMSRLRTEGNKHWPVKGRRRRCAVCSTKRKDTRSTYSCKVCDVALCVIPCFEAYHISGV